MKTKIGNLYRILNKFELIFQKTIEKISVFLMLVLVVDVLYQVLYRFILVKLFSFPAMFTEELARYLVIWIMFLLLPICLKEGRFSSVTLLVLNVKDTARTILYFVVQGLSLAMYIITFCNSFKVIKSNLIFRSPSMNLPGIFIYSSISVGLGLCIIQILIECLGVISGERRPFSSAETSTAGSE